MADDSNTAFIELYLKHEKQAVRNKHLNRCASHFGQMNLTKLAESYVSERPSVKDCLRKGLINYSALARKIAHEHGLDQRKSFDALLVACRRYYRKISKEEILENKIVKLLKDTKLEVKNKIVVVLIEKDIYYNHLIELHRLAREKTEVFHIIEGSSTITIITSHEFLDNIRKVFRRKIIRVTQNLVEVRLKSPEYLEQTLGVVAYLYTLLADKGINIIETMSTWTDTLFVISEKDVAKAMEELSF